MGKIFKGALLGAATAIGVYYYKNPKELEKHKELLKENVKLGLGKVNELINSESEEVDREGEDIAKAKLEEVTAAYNEQIREDVEVTEFVELRSNDENLVEPIEEVVEFIEEDVLEDQEKNNVVEELIKEYAPEVKEQAELAEEEIQLPQEDAPAPTSSEQVETSKVEEVSNIELIEEDIEEKKNELRQSFEERLKIAKENGENAKEVPMEKPKTTLDSIVSLFSTKEDNK
ncbi:hypothetical protein [Gemella cuniculi]|uniref:hypothetical protein n=1 Tax=Gemella cuniculi TaxID=150240 RepID=UPI000406D7C0|nr:hypothetical protein [Gemella cuniculi]